MTIKETPNKITAVLKVTATAEFFDDEASEETVRYCVEQDLEDDGFDVDVELLKEQEAVSVVQREVMHLLVWCCGSCGVAITHGDKFCRNCGQAVKWDGK